MPETIQNPGCITQIPASLFFAVTSPISRRCYRKAPFREPLNETMGQFRAGLAQALTVIVEFKKLVYDSKFTKCAEGMSFVNSSIAGVTLFR